MRKLLFYSGLFILFISFFVSSCMTLRERNNEQTVETLPPSEMTLPKTEIPIPAKDFKFLLPKASQLANITSPRKTINENFSERERKNINVADPLLMGENNSLIIDLSAIQPGDFAFPLPGAKVISPYGGRRRHHAGVDLKTRPRDTIYAAFDGIVRLAKPYYAYGNLIVIRHYNGLETFYSHNSKNLVKPNQKVKAGQPIALTGRTGRATTEHLHFEVRINGQHFNPNMVFDLQERELRHWCLFCTKNKNGYVIRNVDLLPHQLMGDYSPEKESLITNK